MGAAIEVTDLATDC